MKTLKLALLMILLTGSAAAQSTSSTSSAPDVAVIKISWRWVGHNPQLDNALLSANPERALRTAVNSARINTNQNLPLLTVPPVEAPLPIVRSWSGFIYYFTVKNTGAKIIRQLVFEYAFTDPSTQRTVGRRQYKSKVKIRPGMLAKLVVRTSLPPIGTINAMQAGDDSQDQSLEHMVIQRIKYDDGSVWQRGSK
jgi:hypothetical protein